MVLGVPGYQGVGPMGYGSVWPSLGTEFLQPTGTWYSSDIVPTTTSVPLKDTAQYMVPGTTPIYIQIFWCSTTLL